MLPSVNISAMKQPQHLVGSAHHPTDCRLIIDRPALGAWNMAVDEVLLADAAENGIATLRFYQWSEPTLSLGYFQRYEDRQPHAASRDCAAVRRQSGGGAILHDRELTYSLALPAGHPLAQQAEKLYTAVHRAFIDVVGVLIAGRDSRWACKLRERDSDRPTEVEPFLCFQRRSRGDVVVFDEKWSDWKVLGSAQRRRRGAILQHGSLLLEKSPAAPELAGLRDLTGANLLPAELAAGLSVRLGDILVARLSESPLPSGLQSAIDELTNHKYGSPVWTKRR